MLIDMQSNLMVGTMLDMPIFIQNGSPIPSTSETPGEGGLMDETDFITGTTGGNVVNIGGTIGDGNCG